jgi:nucleoside 2-deoxyribosyltransferase
MLVYFAGPDVFWPDYKTHVARIRALAQSKGICPLFPGECVLNGADEIVDQCLLMVQKCDGVIANLNPFRGTEPDSGTVFEVGYAQAMGKWVIGYLADRRPLLARLRDWDQGPAAGSEVCRDGSVVEDFGQPLNIMLTRGLKGLYPDVESAAEAAAGLKKPPLFF